MLRSSRRSAVRLAAELGCCEDTLRRWSQQADLDDGLRDDGLTTEERAELRRLRHENRIVTMERDLPEKAAAFFARESEPSR